ncbi:Mlo-related protein [Artemisia annua]|uniref:Mlo-related protein n=1 Tax=Artemisia annua TaxID=35608 RepID=A0A2U1NVW0_ARTAN|nr:Mlo-related protein [Artemisia annua]
MESVKLATALTITMIVFMAFTSSGTMAQEFAAAPAPSPSMESAGVALQVPALLAAIGIQDTSNNPLPMNISIEKLLSSRFAIQVKKALIAESVRDSLHNWCKRVKERSKTLRSVATRSTCSLGSTIDEGDEEITVASGTLSQSSSTGTLNHMDDDNQDSGPLPQQELSFRMSEYLSDTMRHVPTNHDIEEDEESKVQTLEELFQKT